MPEKGGRPRLPPRWFIRFVRVATAACIESPAVGSGSGDRRLHRWGTLRRTTVGWQTGRPRSVLVGYFEDGSDLVTMAMNGWGSAEPAWWLNLQAHPDARVDLVDGPRLVRAHAATGAERDRVWERWRQIDANLDAYAAPRPSEIAVVVLEPQPAPDG